MKKKGIKELAGEASFCKAIKKTWQAGIDALAKAEKGTGVGRKQEHLEMSRLVHDYETKLHSLVRQKQELAQRNKELEWAFRGLQRENQWMREELFKRQGSQKGD